MNIERIRKKVTNGFKPFRICLTDGRKISVPHPEFIAVGRSIVIVVDKNDDAITIDPLHIMALEEKFAKS